MTHQAKGRPTPESASAEVREAGAEPLEPYPGRVVAPWRIRCLTCGTEGTTRIVSIRDGKSPCYPCARRRGGAKLRKYTAETAAETMRAAGVEPLEPYPGKVVAPWRVRCLTCGTEGTPSLRNVTKGQGACAACGYAERKDVRDVTETEALGRLSSLGVKPLEPFPGKLSIPWRARCLTCGDTLTVNLHGASNGQGVCVMCGYADRDMPTRLSEDVARAEMDRVGLDPLDPYPGNVYTPWRARCRRCEHEVSPRVGSIRQGGGGCRYCGSGIGDSSHGFSGTKPSTIYLVRSDEHEAIKVGIANVGSTRLDQHAREGWRHVRSWEVGTGADARRVEEIVLDSWRSSGIGPAEIGEMRQRGETETASLSEVSEDQALAAIEAAVAVNMAEVRG